MARLRSRGALSLTRSPAIIMSPDVMSSRPTTIRSSVDFPQPDGPTRMTNSPSLMSRLTSFTAGNPSPYFLTMFLSWISAMSAPSALDRTVGEAGNDLPLEQQHEDDDREGDDDRGRRDGARGLFELRGAGEEGERRRHGTRRVGRGERDAVD